LLEACEEVLDLVGPFKKAKGRFTHIFITVDKFTKWVKAKQCPPSQRSGRTLKYHDPIGYEAKYLR
jgi:hypothetical protein